MRIEEAATCNRNIESEVIMYKGEAYTFFDSGLTRNVFANANKTKVIKFLIDAYNFDFNSEEFEIYDSANDDVRSKMAVTELACNGMVIEQEFCSPVKHDNRPMTIPQIMFASSCRNEVGWNANGELVCFDLDEFEKY